MDLFLSVSLYFSLGCHTWRMRILRLCYGLSIKVQLRRQPNDILDQQSKSSRCQVGLGMSTMLSPAATAAATATATVTVTTKAT